MKECFSRMNDWGAVYTERKELKLIRPGIFNVDWVVQPTMEPPLQTEKRDLRDEQRVYGEDGVYSSEEPDREC